LTGFAVVVLSGIACGIWTDRWGDAEQLRAAAERVNAIPLHVGDWIGTEEELSERDRAMGDILSYKARRYVHRTKRTELQFLIVCGQPKYIAVHTPDVCYEGAGYGLQGKLEKYTVTAADGQALGQFQYGRFAKTVAGVPTNYRIMWSFSPDGPWTAPDQPRTVFPRTRHGFPIDRYLYKIYVVRQMARPDEPMDGTDPGVEFLQEMLPELHKVLFPSSPPA
jgi:hypothetical protein